MPDVLEVVEVVVEGRAAALGGVGSGLDALALCAVRPPRAARERE